MSVQKSGYWIYYSYCIWICSVFYQPKNSSLYNNTMRIHIFTFLFVEVWQDKKCFLVKKKYINITFLQHDGLTSGNKQLFQTYYSSVLCIHICFCLAKSRCCESALSSPVWRSQPSKPSVTEVSKFIVIYENMVNVLARIIDGQCATKQ